MSVTDVVVNSIKASQSSDRFAAATSRNVLNDFRSYSYIVTLAAMTRSQYNDPAFFQRGGKFDYVILKTSGKGVKDLQTTSDYYSTNNTTSQSNVTSGETSTTEVKADNATDTPQSVMSREEVNSIIGGFNSSGYGRFDFFLDNLEIDAIWSMVNGSQPQKIRFDVYEPHSINGFTEAIQVNALAAGFENHFDCPFCLKIEFIGYPDGENLPSPKPVPSSTRYFPISITQMTMETSERGTVYKVGCNPKNAFGLGEDGKLATTAKMSGSTVKEVLESLMTQVTEARKHDTGEEETTHYNEYKIEFVGDDPKLVSDIQDAKINEELRSNQVFLFPDPADRDPRSGIRTVETPTTSKYDPTTETITFSSSVAITDAICAVVRDSKYTEFLLGSLEDVKKKNNGMVPWFRVSIGSKIKPGKNEKTGAVNFIYTYTVRPYLIHYTRLPGEGRGMFSKDDLKGFIKRSYNYLYTGKNVDILNYNLKFNWLYFQERPYNMGNKDDNATATARSAPNTPQVIEGKTAQSGANEDQKGIQYKTNTANSSVTPPGGSGKAPQSTPYFKLGQALHEALLDSVDFNSIDLTILGDPYYLVTSDVGNQDYQESTGSKGITTNGEAPYLGGDVLIDLNFRTPKDIKPNGWADFGEGLLPFSGVYRVQSVSNIFREGKFEQRVLAYRLAGQTLKTENIQSVAGALVVKPKPGSQQTKDTAPSSVSQFGSRASEASLLNLISRGLPTVGLPGLLSNFSNAVGGALGGVNTALQTTLQRVDTAVSDVLAPVNGVLQQAQAALNIAAQVGGVVAAGQALINGFDTGLGGAPGLNNISYDPTSAGIRVNTDGLNEAYVGDSLSNQASVVSQSRIISSFIQDGQNLRTLNQNYYNNVLSERLKASDRNLSNVGNRADAVTNSTPVDPKALAYKLGINPSQLSGLSGSQQSNVLAQLMALAEKVPENTDIAGLKALGISLKNLYGINIPNLPALQPLTTAPLANVPALDIQKILASGGDIKNLEGMLAIPSIAAFLALLKQNKNVPDNGVVGGAGQLNVQSTLDKLETAQSMGINLQSSANFSEAQIGLGSVESNNATNRKIVQGYGGYYVVSKTTYAQFGTQRDTSPIDKLMQTKV